MSKSSTEWGRLIGLIVLGLALLAPIDPSTERYPLSTIATMPENFRKGWANLVVLDTALYDFYVFEGRFPRSYDELINSEEMPIRPEDFLNPYSGGRVESAVTRSRGNVRYVYDVDNLQGPDVRLEVYLDPAGDGKNIERLSWLGDRWHMRSDMESFRARYEGEDKYAGNDRRMWFICRQIANATARMLSRFGTIPRSYDEAVRQYNWWLNSNIKNPYTGQLIQPVTIPSAGDFTFVGLLNGEDPSGGYVDNFIVCYDHAGKPMFPSPMTESIIANYIYADSKRPPDQHLLVGLPDGVTFKKKDSPYQPAPGDYVYPKDGKSRGK